MAHVSIIINNYNYDAYLGAAIDSALAQSYQDCEVIVVDDGSQDGSVALIESYGDRVRPVLKSNGGQASAFNAGMAAASGDWILFLDADDMLDANAIELILTRLDTNAESPAVIEFYLRNIGAGGTPFADGSTMPKRLTECGQLQQLLKTGAYGYAPTSGNLFHRSCLSEILPMPEAEYRISADLYLLTLAPFCGPVQVLPKPALGSYRIHGKNNYYNGPIDLEQFDRELLVDLKNESRKQNLVREWSLQKRLKLGRCFGNISSRLIFRRMLALKKFGSNSPFAHDKWANLWGMLLTQIFNIRSIRGLASLCRMTVAGLCVMLTSAYYATGIGRRAL
jgi:glycosyltransferase involved in cell wall biosynthesis